MIYAGASNEESTAWVCLEACPVNTFTSDLEKVTQSTLISLADDSKLGDADNKLQGRATILRNTDRPEKEAARKGPMLKRICGYQWRRG